VYDYGARYTAGATEYHAPARLASEVEDSTVHEAAAAAAALGLRDLTRVDLMIDGAGVPWVLEVNVSPGMTETSLAPMAARAAGLSLTQMCDAVLASAGRRSAPPHDAR
jgi:D-alanine-D-alanine ligase